MGTGARERNERHNVASKMKTWEIRLNDDGSLDEVVANKRGIKLYSSFLGHSLSAIHEVIASAGIEVPRSP